MAGNWGTQTQSGGKDNSNVLAKRAVRKWLCSELNPRSVFEVYGPGGVGMRQYRDLCGVSDFGGTEGDAIESLWSLERWDYDVWDIDPYSDPYIALEYISQRLENDRVGFFLTDGVLRKQAQRGGRLPKKAVEYMGWHNEKRHLKRWIYYNYPQVARRLISKIIAPRTLSGIRVFKAKGSGAANYIGVISDVA